MSGISTSHDTHPPKLIVHLVWGFLVPSERTTLCHLFQVLSAYARLRFYAASRPPSYWEYLHSMGPISLAASSLSRRRAYDMSAVLLLLHFDVGDLVRWLGGDYTHDHVPLQPIVDAVAAIRNHPRPPGYPVVD